MKLLITGATGFLGREVTRRLAAEHTVMPVGGRHAPEGGIALDLRRRGVWRPLLAEHRPDWVVHLAAYREPDFCEENPEETRALNTAPVIELMHELPASTRVLFVSTDYVFDGDSPPYREDSPRRAVNEYGRSKIEAEDAVLTRPDSIVLRIPLLVGSGPTFESSGFLYQIVCALRSPAPQTADAVLRRFPTWIRDVAEAIGFLIGQGFAGVVHYSGEEAMTRHDMIRAAADVLGWSAGHIRPSSEVVPRRAARPRDSQLATDLIRRLGFSRFTPFAEVVRSFVNDFPQAAGAGR
ncbi:MAG: SDR family oxidoreductase [Kiritimatiellae bacterium]|nr:SDR family oxidoreductase [Kiritimatiellia bacterium]